METISENRAFGGVQGVYRHSSSLCECDMTFGLFLPPQAETHPVPVLWFLSGLTCTHENAMLKSGAQVWAAEAGLALVFPDTSPRGPGVADDDSPEMGQGAGFYVNASEAPWARHFQMWDYIAQELPERVGRAFAVDMGRQAITGHSMGGHGALTLAMGLEGQFRSVSAFAPICHPTQSGWGRDQLAAYLGPDENHWRRHDATLMMQAYGFSGPVLVDQGSLDPHLGHLRPEDLGRAMLERRQQGLLRMHPGYDHSYFFVASHMRDHVQFHAEALAA